MEYGDDQLMTTILPTNRAIRYFVNADEPIVGVTQVGDLTGVNPTLDVVESPDDNDFLGNVPVEALDPLPPQGTQLDAGDVYADGDRAVLVRQPHICTEHAVDDLIPTLFLVHRPDIDGIAWVTGEPVTVGTIRTYDGETYRCKQSHTTQPDWWPSKAGVLDVLWEVYEEPQPGEQWVDSGETVTALYSAGVIGVTNTEPFTAEQSIRISGDHEATVTRTHQPGSPGILVIDPHVNVSGGESIEIWQ